MKLSIRFRIVQLSAAAIVAMTALCGVLFWSLGRAEMRIGGSSTPTWFWTDFPLLFFAWTKAESAQRGYLFTANATFIPVYRDGVADYQARLRNCLS